MTCSNAVGATTIGSAAAVAAWQALVYQLISQKAETELKLVDVTGPAVLGDNEEYNSDLVAEILAADAAPPEEPGFDNVVDLLEWLNRD